MSWISNWQSNHYRKLESQARVENRRHKDSLPAMNGELLMKDPWLIKSQHCQDNQYAESERSASVPGLDTFLTEQHSYSELTSSLPEHVQVFQALLFGDSHSSGGESEPHGNTYSVTRNELESRRKQQANNAASTFGSASKSANSFLEANEGTHSTNPNTSVNEFQIEAPAYGKINVAVIKEGGTWSVELKSSSLVHSEGLKKFASLIEAALRKKIGAEIKIKIC